MAVRTLGERVSARVRFGHTREKTFCGAGVVRVEPRPIESSESTSGAAARRYLDE